MIFLAESRSIYVLHVVHHTTAEVAPLKIAVQEVQASNRTVLFFGTFVSQCLQAVLP